MHLVCYDSYGTLDTPQWVPVQ